jgi:ABC-type transport system involved in cytochrome c biogenesis permease subunit
LLHIDVVLTIMNIFKERKCLIIWLISCIVIVAFCITHVGLIARWYISGHAPWSNAYESIIYVAWATMFLVWPLTESRKLLPRHLLTAMILAAAYMNWIDPEIANLQPVLNSYWLMIHVAVIVAAMGLLL